MYVYKPKPPAESRQRQVLKFLLQNGGKGTSNQIAQALQLKNNNVWAACIHLKRRQLISTKVVGVVKDGHYTKNSHHALLPKKKELIEKIVKEMDV